jgi:hypothetical protein
VEEAVDGAEEFDAFDQEVETCPKLSRSTLICSTPKRISDSSSSADEEEVTQRVDGNSSTLITPGRRGSILNTANKDMLNCLNKMFSSNTLAAPTTPGVSTRMSMIGNKSSLVASGTPLVSRRTTMACGAAANTADADDMAPFSMETVAKRTQSKLLKVRMIGLYFTFLVLTMCHAARIGVLSVLREARNSCSCSYEASPFFPGPN